MTALRMLIVVLALIGRVPVCSAEVAGGPAAESRNGVATANDGMAEFDRLTREWKAASQKIRSLQFRYLTAAETSRPALKRAYDQQLAAGDALRQQLIAEAKTVLRNTKHATTRKFVLFWGAASAMHDDYEPAQEAIDLLLADGPIEDEIAEFVGRVAYALSDADGAEPYLKQASTLDKFSTEAKNDLANIDGLRQGWQAELAVRAAEAQADDLPRVLLSTSEGDITLELFENEAPNTVANFISLVESKFYNGTPFHRVLPAFMAQGGDPKGDGTGGPTYMIPCELDRDDYRRHFRGSLSMAHAGKDTGGSQFFLTFRPTPALDGQHTVFGRVIDGMPVLAKLQRIDPERASAELPDRIVDAKVLRKRDHDYVPRTLEPPKR